MWSYIKMLTTTIIRLLTFGVLLTAGCCAFAQPAFKKTIAVKTTNPPKIDGNLDDAAWQNVPAATDFIELTPTAGLHEKPEQRTEIKIVYDDNAVYVGARMWETGKVARELTTRDNVANDDFIGIVLDTYYDRINASGFYVTAAGVQYDAKYSNTGNEDSNWNAVWFSSVKVDGKGWTAEFKIPYSALRFSSKDVQTWGLNFVRNRQFAQTKVFWNEINPKKNGFINQEGELDSLEHIKPPVRLALYPYFSAYLNNYPYNKPGIRNTSTQVNGGMDIKYGLSAGFTLDMTLIPDFGQVQSDNQILNLTPFEVKYNENRPFFTEGTELFNKGNLFYSRRVGGRPIDHDQVAAQLSPHEVIINNPAESKLINATKISGRLSNGLGIGVFNALSDPAYAIVEDSLTHDRRKVQTASLTNYNILVLDQNLRNNSAITFINTNVDRFGKDYNADVTGMVFSLYNKRNSYNVSGYTMMSNLFYPHKKPTTGFSYELNGGKTLGNFTWNVVEDLVDGKYNSNDLGIMFNNNYLDHNFNLQYFNYKPKKYFTQWGIFSNIYYSRRYNPSAYQYLNGTLGLNLNLKNFWYVFLNYNHQQEGNDFYEPRITARVFRAPGSNSIGGGLNTNRAKRLHGGMNTFYHKLNRLHGYGYDAEVFYTYELSDKISVGEDLIYSPRIHYTGYSTTDSASNNPVFALRDRQTVENIFNFKYTFNNIMGLTLRVRHYWSKLNNKQYFDLAQNGTLTGLTSTHFSRDNDQNYNAWNIDMIYAWVFSPGSELSIAWKNSALTNTDQAHRNYFYNLHDTLIQPQNNNISVKVLYYIDYQNLRKKKS